MNKVKATSHTKVISYAIDNQRIQPGMLHRIRLTQANVTALANSKYISLFAMPDKQDGRRDRLASELLNKHGYYVMLTAKAKGNTIFLVTRPNDGVCRPSTNGNELMRTSQSHELQNPALSPEQTAEIVNACFANECAWFPMTLFRKLGIMRDKEPFSEPHIAEVCRTPANEKKPRR